MVQGQANDLIFKTLMNCPTTTRFHRVSPTSHPSYAEPQLLRPGRDFINTTNIFIQIHQTIVAHDDK